MAYPLPLPAFYVRRPLAPPDFHHGQGSACALISLKLLPSSDIAPATSCKGQNSLNLQPIRPDMVFSIQHAASSFTHRCLELMARLLKACSKWALCTKSVPAMPRHAVVATSSWQNVKIPVSCQSIVEIWLGLWRHLPQTWELPHAHDS